MEDFRIWFWSATDKQAIIANQGQDIMHAYRNTYYRYTYQRCSYYTYISHRTKDHGYTGHDFIGHVRSGSECTWYWCTGSMDVHVTKAQIICTLFSNIMKALAQIYCGICSGYWRKGHRSKGPGCTGHRYTSNGCTSWIHWSKILYIPHYCKIQMLICKHLEADFTIKGTESNLYIFILQDCIKYFSGCKEYHPWWINSLMQFKDM